MRFGVVGLLSNAVGFLLYLAVTAGGMKPKVAMTVVYALGVFQSFAFNQRWSFGHERTCNSAFIRYCAAYGLGYALNFGSLHILVDHFGHPHAFVQGVTVLTLAVLLFVLQKFWVFRSHSSLHHANDAMP